MNERIRELAEQAREYANSSQPYEKIKNKAWIDVYDEKFAELIVQECANLLVKEAKSSHDEGSETYDTLIRESNWMKRYFGVE